MAQRNRFMERKSKAGAPKVVIIGAGFAGLWVAKKLNKQPVEAFLIDKTNYHTFLPLLYQVAAAEIEPEEIAYPVRTILRDMKNVDFVMTEIHSIDFDKQLVISKDITIAYDYLVIAAGSATQFFNTPGALEHSYQLKSLEHAIMLRSQILRCFELAVVEGDEARRKRLLTFTIIGGGATGVEFAGALAELVHGPLVKDFPTINFDEVRVLLLEAANGVLLSYPKSLQDYTVESLRGMGVDVMLETFVSEVTENSVVLKDKGIIETETVVWTAGVKGESIAESIGLPCSRSGRVNVLPTLQVENHENIYVIGDIAGFEQDGEALPMLAPVATQQGQVAAQNILNQIDGKPTEQFKYVDRGMMVTIGRKKAIALVGTKPFKGLFAWIMWLVIHLYNLIGFKNRIVVFLHWANDYIFYERAIRLILPFKKTSLLSKNGRKDSS